MDITGMAISLSVSGTIDGSDMMAWAAATATTAVSWDWINRLEALKSMNRLFCIRLAVL